jgi:hypothetical protein
MNLTKVEDIVVTDELVNGSGELRFHRGIDVVVVATGPQPDSRLLLNCASGSILGWKE